MSTFAKQGERVVQEWLLRQGYTVTSSGSIHDSRARRGQLLTFVNGAPRWVEVRTKTKDVFYNKTQEHRQGIESRSFDDYLYVQRESGVPGFLAFLVRTPEPIKLRLAPLNLLDANKCPGVMGEVPHVFWPIEIFETHEVVDGDLVAQAPDPQRVKASHVWEKPAPTSTVQQGFFTFGGGAPTAFHR